MKNRVLVIGATGYIGRHLLTKLGEDLDNQIYGLSNPGDPNAVHWRSFEGDLLNPNLKNLLETIQPDEIYHAAGVHRFAPLDEQLVFHADGTHHLLTSLHEAGLSSRVVILSSAAEYGPQDHAVDETAFPRPQSEYGVAKLAQTMTAQMLAAKYNLPVIIARLFNVYGQSSQDFVIGSLNTQFASAVRQGLSCPRIKTQNTQSYRDFIHIEDAVEAFIALAKKGYPGEIYNVASGNATNIETLIEMLAEKTGYDDFHIDAKGEQKQDFSEAIIDKITQQTGWTPKISISEGLDRELKQYNLEIPVKNNI